MSTITVSVDPREPLAPRACSSCGSPWLRPDDPGGLAWSCLLCGATTVKGDPLPLSPR